MSAIQSLQKLVGTLSPKELAICRSYFTAFDSRGEKHTNKALKLLTLLENRKDLHEPEFEFLIYGKRNAMAFSKLLSRLRDKLLDVLILPVNNNRIDALNAINRTRYCLHWRFMQLPLLIERGQYDLAELLLHTMDNQAEEYELFAERNRVLKYRQIIACKNGNEKNMHLIAKIIRRNNRRFYFLKTCRQLLTLSKTSGAEGIPEKIRELQLFAKKYGSARASFLLLEIQARLAEQNNDYKTATRTRNKQLRLIGCEPALQNERKQTETCYQLALLYLKQKRFAQALQSIESGLDRPGIKPPIFRRLTEIQISAMILLDKTLLALSVLNNIAPDDKIYYLKAVTLFLLHDYAEALEIMENISYIKLDASGCGTAARILTQMLTIENYRESNSRFVIRKLKSLDRKMPLAVHLNAREQLIVDLMQALIIENLDFKKVYQQFQDHIEKLRMTDGETAWQPEHGELIVFQEWFMAKVLSLSHPANWHK